MSKLIPKATRAEWRWMAKERYLAPSQPRLQGWVQLLLDHIDELERLRDDTAEKLGAQVDRLTEAGDAMAHTLDNIESCCRKTKKCLAHQGIRIKLEAWCKAKD